MKTGLVLLLGLARVAAQQPGTFIAVAEMSTPRYGHSATLLPNGKVLIAGGVNASSTALATAELYDPVLRVFGPTGSMKTARAHHTATLLPNDRVLILGGGAGVEIYDPDTGIFTAASQQIISKGNPIDAMLLSDGNVLIEELDLSVAGIGNFGELTFTRYDPDTRTSVSAGVCPVPGSMTLLPNDRVVIAWFAVYVYDPRNATCVITSPGISNSPLGPSVLLPAGQVLFAGGQDDPGETTAAGLYDPAGEFLAPTGSLTTARADHTTILLSDGQVLLAGAQLAGGKTIASSELYDPTAGVFRVTGSMNTSRAGASATLLPNGDVLIAGGFHNDTCCGSGQAIASAEVYHPTGATPSPQLFSMPGDRSGQGAIWHAETAEIAAPDCPASAGDVLSMYTTGLIAGGVIPPRVSVGGRRAEVLFFGAAPDYPGYYQVNFRVPKSVAAGTLPVRLDYLSRTSNETTISVR